MQKVFEENSWLSFYQDFVADDAGIFTKEEVNTMNEQLKLEKYEKVEGDFCDYFCTGFTHNGHLRTDFNVL